MDIRKLQKAVISALEDIKAVDIAVFDVTHLTAEFDRMIVASAHSARQTKALAGHVQEKAKKAGAGVCRMEGEDSGEWILVDLGDIVVHVMQPRVRAYYNLEELWNHPKPKPVPKPPAASATAAGARPKAITDPKATTKPKPRAKPDTTAKPKARSAPTTRTAPTGRVARPTRATPATRAAQTTRAAQATRAAPRIKPEPGKATAHKSGAPRRPAAKRVARKATPRT